MRSLSPLALALKQEQGSSRIFRWAGGQRLVRVQLDARECHAPDADTDADDPKMKRCIPY